MAIITRPTKTGGGTDVVAGNDLLAIEWNGDLNTIYTDYDGNITDANCSSVMNLQGTKLADAPNGVPTVKINDSAITPAKIAALAVILSKVKTAFFDWTPGGTLGPGNGNSISTGLTEATAIPLHFTIRNNGNPAGDGALITLSVWLNTATGNYHISVGNPSTNNRSLTGLTFRLLYIPAS